VEGQDGIRSSGTLAEKEATGRIMEYLVITKI
jgi:hypothetical protein